MNEQRALVMGLGHHGGGVAAVRWLVEQGVRVAITDMADESQLADSLAQLAEVPIERFTLGRHDERDFRLAQVIVVNPAVKPDHPLLKLATQSRASLTSEIELFLEHCPATVIGVTGTTGKSTTCAMLAEICRHAGRCTWLGGNIGHSLLDALKHLQAADLVVLELSSFQLAHLSAHAKLPPIAVVTNCSRHHLNWHGSWDNYVKSKQRLLSGGVGQQVLLNPFDLEVSGWARLAERRVLPLADASVLPDRLALPGQHNRQNALLAATAARALKIEDQAIREGLAGFSGLPHRLQFVGSIGQRRFYNDSKATSPTATIASLAAISGPIWLLAGGADQGQDWTALTLAMERQARGVILFGEAKDALAAAMALTNKAYPVGMAATLDEAMVLAFQKSQPGDAILLAPACPSSDQFADFAERGQRFETLFHALAAS